MSLIFIIEYVKTKQFLELLVHSEIRAGLIPNGIPLIPFSYLSSEQKCLRRSVSSAVWDGIRPDFSIYPPPAPSSTSLSPLISCSHFMMTGNPAGLEGRHLSSHSQEGIFLVICGDYDLNAPQRSCDPSPASPFPLQIKTVTVKSANHQMYDNHFPQAHYCSAHGRRTGLIIMFLPFPQLWWFSTNPFPFSKVTHIHEATRTCIPRVYKTCLYMIVCPGKEYTYIINCTVAESQIQGNIHNDIMQNRELWM